MNYTIYEIRHIPSGRCYIGCTRRGHVRRFEEHMSTRGGAQHLSSAVAKLGRDSFCITVLEEFDERLEAMGRETALIKERDTFWPKGFNSRPVGGAYARPRLWQIPSGGRFLRIWPVRYPVTEWKIEL